MDCIVRAWINGAITDDLADAVMERDSMAQATWRATEFQILGNNETRALSLNIEFWNFCQGDLSIIDYYCRL